MGNSIPFIVLIAINLVVFVGLGGLTGDTDIGFLSLGLRNTLDITQEGENSTISVNSTGADFSELQGTSGVSLGTLFNTLFLVLRILLNIVVASVGLPILILFASGLPVEIAIPLAGITVVIQVLSIFLLVKGGD